MYIIYSQLSHRKSKHSQVLEAFRNCKIMPHFLLSRTLKYKILLICLLDMAKFIIISFILVECIPIYSIFNLSQKFPSSKESQVRQGHSQQGTVPKFLKPFSKLDQFSNKSPPSPLSSKLIIVESFPYSWPTVCMGGSSISAKLIHYPNWKLFCPKLELF